MQSQIIIICLLVLNVHCEDLVTKQPYIYDRYGLAKVNFFTREKWSYVGCMKFCQNMGGRAPPVRTKKEQYDMKGMLKNLRAFPPFPKELFLSVTSGEVDDTFDLLKLEHWPQDILEAKDGLWRDYYTGEKL